MYVGKVAQTRREVLTTTVFWDGCKIVSAEQLNARDLPMECATMYFTGPLP